MLEIEEIACSYGKIEALRKVSLQAKANEVTCLLGPNGAGKTSLFNTISGFYKPSAGSIRFKGLDISTVPAPQRAKMGLGRSFQNIALFRGMR